MKRHLAVIAPLLFVFLICAIEPQIVLGASAAPSVAKYMKSDGRMDLEAMRASGYQGPLDLEGYDVRVDRRSREPVVRPAGTGRALDNPDDAYWSEGFGIPGVNDWVIALTVYDNKLVAGGYFTAAGDVMARCIAAWDGSTWSPLGSGIDGGVEAMTVYDDKLIAAGGFTTAGGVEANGIAAWDGSTWSPLGSGVDGGVSALTAYGEKLIAGGGFTTAGGVEANGIASWDGSTWSALGSGINGGASALTVYDEKLIAGGGFITAGGMEANNVAAWDGAAWSPLGSGLEGAVYALTVYGNEIIAVEQTYTDDFAVVAWDGSVWTQLGSSFGLQVYALAVYDNTLMVGMDLGVYAWDGSVWSPLCSRYDSGMNSISLAVYDNKLIAGGIWFNTACGVAAVSVTAWDGVAWSALGSTGINEIVVALTVYDDKVIAGGGFITAGDVDANYVAAWDGTAWSPLGEGMEYEPYPPSTAVHALTVYDNKLIVGGYFTKAGGVAANRVAAWDGSAWSPLAEGTNSYVLALTVYNDKLIAGGYFTMAGSVEANNIAAWDGSTWSPLGSGMNYGVLALSVYDNKLIAGGGFTTAGSVEANRVAAWDGSGWSPLGSGMSEGWDSPLVYALTVYDSKLIAGGNFTVAGGVPATGVVAWDGSVWSALGSGVNYPVHALTVYDNKLIAGGEFWEVGGLEAPYIAAWDGSAWSPLGSGVNDWVEALTVYDNTLMAGGWMSVAGDKVSGYIAQWTKHTSTATMLQSFTASLQGSAVEVEWELSEQVPDESFVIERAERAVERGGSSREFVELHGADVTEDGLHYCFSDTDIEPGMTYRYRVALRSEVGSLEILFETESIAIPALTLTLFQNEPNPFNPSTKIRYYVPENVEVTLGVYDAGGRLVVALSEQEKQPGGYHEVEWNGRDARGKAVASGVYFCRLGAGKLTQTRKMIVLR